MFQNISRKYIDFCIGQQTKNISRKKHYANLKDISSISVLLSSANVNEKELEEINKMLGEKKKVSIWIFRSQPSSLKDTIQRHFFDNKEISILQKPSEKIEKSFRNENPELLIDLTTREILPLKYLLGISPALCRCGMKKGNYNLYDLEIDAPDSIKEIELLKQIIFYLETIQTKL